MSYRGPTRLRYFTLRFVSSTAPDRITGGHLSFVTKWKPFILVNLEKRGEKIEKENEFELMADKRIKT
jgi:hypothetical protein